MVSPAVHELSKLEEQTGNLPAYRWYVECTCGFQARLATKQAAKSQYDAHLQYHGSEPYFSKLDAEMAEKESNTSTSAPTGQQGQEVKPWKPDGVK